MEYRYGSDEERTVKKELGWDKFKSYLIEKNPNLNIDKLLESPNIKKDPVSSCGLIEFVETEDAVFYHVFRRRHTLEFDILVKGLAPKHQLYDLISLLSKDERTRIKNVPIEKIWEDYWVDDCHPEITHRFKTKLEEVKEILIKLDDMIPCLITERPFIFPKGRPNRNETGLEAALNEPETPRVG